MPPKKQKGPAKKFGEKTEVITVRVPGSKKAAIAKKIAEILKPYIK